MKEEVKGQAFEVRVRTVINEKGQAISSMKLEGLASASQVVLALENIIGGIKLKAAQRADA